MVKVYHLLPAVEVLYLTRRITPHVAPVGERATEVSPALRSILLEEPGPASVQKIVEPFITARQLDGYHNGIFRCYAE